MLNNLIDTIQFDIESLVANLKLLLEVDLLDDSQVMHAANSIESFVFYCVENGYSKSILEGLTNEDIEKSRQIIARSQFIADAQMMQQIEEGKVSHPNQWQLQETGARIVAQEVQLACSNKKMAFCGSGWPGTAIEWLTKYGIPSVCVEINPEIAQRAKWSLDKLGLLGKDKITIVPYDAAVVNLYNFHNIVLAAMLPYEIKNAIIKNVLQQTIDPEDNKILYRAAPDDLRILLYNPYISTLSKVKEVSMTMPASNDPVMTYKLIAYPLAAVGRGDDYYIIQARNRLIEI